MKKFNLLIAALHASALALGTTSGVARAQDAAEIRAYMNALSVGTPEAMQRFLSQYPGSTLPGSALGASIAASIDKPTSGVGGNQGSGSQSSSGRDSSSSGDVY